MSMYELYMFMRRWSIDAEEMKRYQDSLIPPRERGRPCNCRPSFQSDPHSQSQSRRFLQEPLVPRLMVIVLR